MMGAPVYSRFSSQLTLIAVLFIAGCGGGEEVQQEAPASQPNAVEIMQKQLTDLRAENASLRARVLDLEQSNRTAVARTAELESQLASMRESAAKSEPPPPPTPKMDDPRASYQEALELFKSRRYDEAAGLLRALIDSGVTASLEDNCRYWLGECAFGSKRFPEAIAQFEKVFGFETSEKKDDAQVMIARSHAAMGDRARAKEAYERLVKKFPASPFVPFARDQIAKL